MSLLVELFSGDAWNFSWYTIIIYHNYIDHHAVVYAGVTSIRIFVIFPPSSDGGWW